MSFGYIILPTTEMADKAYVIKHPPPFFDLVMDWDPSCCLLYCFSSLPLSLFPICWPKA